MTNHPNRSWRKRWRVDTASLTATHDNGLSVTFDAAPDTEGALDGKANHLPEDIPFDELPHLMREAGDVMLEAIKAEPKQ